MVLGIHVIGAGFGESIVVEMPNGRVGVIDCFASQLKATTQADRLRANPTLRFLVNELKIESLAFLGFTHPHEDHGRGLSHILAAFRGRIDRIWVFPGCGEVALERHFRALQADQRRLPGERLLDELPGTFYRELLRIQELIDEQSLGSGPAQATLDFFSGHRAVDIPGEPIRVHFLGPASVIARRYLKAIDDNMKGLIIQGEGTESEKLVVNPSWQPDDVNHNRVSAALLIEYGSTRVLLGGDMENEAWEQCLVERNRAGTNPPRLTSRLVKVSHHGSTTGYVDGLYRQHFTGHSKPVAVLTPFNRHHSPLPSREGLQGVLPWVSELFATNLVEARLACAPAETSTPLPSEAAVPASLLPLLKRQPALWGALHPALIQSTEQPAPLSELPAEFLPVLRAEPALVALLRPQLRKRWVRQEAGAIGHPETHSRLNLLQQPWAGTEEAPLPRLICWPACCGRHQHPIAEARQARPPANRNEVHPEGAGAVRAVRPVGQTGRFPSDRLRIRSRARAR